eukprot:XP_011673676.1 PREDICTED: ankyrin repeat and death domain-containing protein 1B-like [Strongylocentrotus purpuratus]
MNNLMHDHSSKSMQAPLTGRLPEVRAATRDKEADNFLSRAFGQCYSAKAKFGGYRSLSIGSGVAVCPAEQSGGDTSNYLLQITSRFGSNIMHTACKHGHLDIVHILHDLCPGLLVAKNTNGLTPLHYACRGNYAEVAEKLCDMLRSQENDLKLNLDNEIDGSPSLLKFTALKGSSDCLVVLLKHAKPDLSTMVELIKWISVEKNLFLVLQKLLNNFDDISTGCDSTEIEKIILPCAAKGQTESLLEFVGWHKKCVSTKDEQGNTAMHLIAQGGDLDIAKALLKSHDDVGLCEKNSLGQTPLHLAIKRGHRLTTKLFLETNKKLANMQDEKDLDQVGRWSSVHASGRWSSVVRFLQKLYAEDVEEFNAKARSCFCTLRGLFGDPGVV